MESKIIRQVQKEFLEAETELRKTIKATLFEFNKKYPNIEFNVYATSSMEVLASGEKKLLGAEVLVNLKI